MPNTGSLINMLADSSVPTVPEVGQGATLIYWTDRTPATVVAIERNGRLIVVQEDTATRTDSNGMSDAQSYEYERNPNGRTHEATLRKDGSYRLKGGQTRVALGARSKYHDFSF